MRPRAAVVSLRQAVSWLGVAEVRNIAMAVMLHGEVFVAPGHEPESEELWGILRGTNLQFPTMTEAYRIAAFDVMKQRAMAASAALNSARAVG